MRIALALVVTFILLVFSREVSRAAHQENAARQSENLSFGVMATNLLIQENDLDAQMAGLLTTGSHLSRTAFALQLSQLAQAVASWRDAAGLMKTPVLSPSLNVTLARDTLRRANAYDTILADVAQGLSLVGPAASAPAPSLGRAQLSLLATAASWGSLRHELSHSPGHVTLGVLSDASARLNIPQYLQTLAAAPALAPTRDFVIGAVQVQPAPFPAPVGTLMLAPTTTMQVQVAVSNLRVIAQPVVVSMVLTPRQGPAQRVTLTSTVAPTSSFAFDSHRFAVFPGEQANFSITLEGDPAAVTLVHRRNYLLIVAPLGLG